jgi:hypothetical protein
MPQNWNTIATGIRMNVNRTATEHSGGLSCCQYIADKFGDIPGIYFLSIYLHSADRHHELYSTRKKVQYPPFSQPIKM